MEPIKFGPLTLQPFGLLLAPLAFGALALTAFGMRKAGLKKETAGWFALLAVPLCFLLSRLGFCLFVVDQMMGSKDFGMIFRVQEGGFLLFGAIGGGLLAAWITGKITGQDAGRIADRAVVAACLLIAAGRIICGLVYKTRASAWTWRPGSTPRRRTPLTASASSPRSITASLNASPSPC